MPQRKIILTLSNSDDAPDDMQIHIEAEQPVDDDSESSEAQLLLNETTLALTERFIQMLEEDAGD